MLKPLSPEANRLNHLLWRLNLINVEAAEMAGVSERTIYRWLAGTTKVPPSALKVFEMTLRLREASMRG
jgi:hypothetical protein